MANALEVSSDFLTNGISDDLADSSLTDKELLNQFKQIDREKQAFYSILDALVAKKKMKDTLSSAIDLTS